MKKVVVTAVLIALLCALIQYMRTPSATVISKRGFSPVGVLLGSR